MDSRPSASKVMMWKCDYTQDIQGIKQWIICSDEQPDLPNFPIETPDVKSVVQKFWALTVKLLKNANVCSYIDIVINATVVLSLQGCNNTKSHGFSSNRNHDENQSIWGEPSRRKSEHTDVTTAWPPWVTREENQQRACGFYFGAAWLAPRLQCGAALLHRKRCVFASDKQA